MPTKADLEVPGRQIGVTFCGVQHVDDATRMSEGLLRNMGRILTGRPDVPLRDPNPELTGDEDGEPQGPLSHLRLLVFTSDLPAAALHWQQELGLIETGVTNREEARAVGKVFTWRDGAGNLHGIALFDLLIGWGLTSDNPRALALVAHEFTHLWAGPMIEAQLGFVKNAPVHRYIWVEIWQHLAVNCFEEMVAERHASALHDEAAVRDSGDMLVDLARILLVETREEAAEYRHTNDFDGLWDTTITRASAFISHLGRVTGLTIDDDTLSERLLERLREVSPDFAEIVQEARCVFHPIAMGDLELSWASLAGAEALINSVFCAAGILPYSTEAGLGLKVPWWPGEHERAVREYHERLARGVFQSAGS